MNGLAVLNFSMATKVTIATERDMFTHRIGIYGQIGITEELVEYIREGIDEMDWQVEVEAVRDGGYINISIMTDDEQMDNEVFDNIVGGIATMDHQIDFDVVVIS